jgi:hypothetical protein
VLPVAVVLIVAGAALLSAAAALLASPFGWPVAVGAACLVAGVLAMLFGVDAARDVPLEVEATETGSGE